MGGVRPSHLAVSEESGAMRIIRRHNMTKDAAKSKVDSLVSELMRQFGESLSNLRYGWGGYVIEFSGRRAIFNIRGRLEVTDDELVLDVEGIPFFSNGEIRIQLEQWFDENWPG